MASQVSDVVSEWFDLPPEVMEELMFCDLEEDDDLGEIVSNAATSEQQSKCRADISELLSTVRFPHPPELTEEGMRRVEGWLHLQDKPEAIALTFSEVCANPGKYTTSNSQLDSADYMLAVMNHILEKREVPIKEEVVSASISAREGDILEYMAGYTLRKAIAKFPDHSTVFAQLLASKPCGKLLPLMERKIAALKYPSMDLLFLLRRIYIDFTRECSKSPSAIDFSALHDKVRSSAYVQSFCISMVRALGHEGPGLKLIINYIIGLFLRVLGYSFTRKLVQKLRKGSNKRFSRNPRRFKRKTEL